MNQFEGNIVQIHSCGQLSIVTVELLDRNKVQSIIIDTSDTAPYLVLDTPVFVLFKETEVAISPEENPKISLQNRFRGKITAIEKGELLVRLSIETAAGNLVSMISKTALTDLDLFINDWVTALVKLNEITLSPK
ncbi:TOBE domain-containing protein [Echinicola sp. CAU 1574]|uniref:TOBE domain-containing protein n=1 Tax=Echinicola arenosa TaxID=2774144 RepID=A0ABR9AJS4_9BACT|nr:TOBE domain-containing protein [Echinicola arenosa]MBD8489056.1 TOBE domain-containing protein [Echinicola arenosa]